MVGHLGDAPHVGDADGTGIHISCIEKYAHTAPEAPTFPAENTTCLPSNVTPATLMDSWRVEASRTRRFNTQARSEASTAGPGLAQGA